MKRGKLGFFVKSVEQNFCPCCGGRLKVSGSRTRKYIKSSGNIIVLIIRRLRCDICGKTHHELPDILVPYKRYDSESIEAVVTNNSNLAVAADESTISRWKSWFRDVKKYLLGCLISVAIKMGKESVEGPSCLPASTLEGIWHYVGDASGWLSRVVRSAVNSNFWAHTRSAFLSS